MSNPQEFSEQEKQAVRDFFEKDVPHFHFDIRVQPLSSASLTNRREMLRLIRGFNTSLHTDSIINFLKSVCSTTEFDELSEFEQEVVSSHGWFCFLHAFDVYKGKFDGNVREHTYQYLRITGRMNDDNWDSFKDCIILSNVTASREEGARNFGEVSEVGRFIELSDNYVVLVEMNDGDDFYIPLSAVLSYRGVSDEEIATFLKEAQEAVDEINKINSMATAR